MVGLEVDCHNLIEKSSNPRLLSIDMNFHIIILCGYYLPIEDCTKLKFGY